MNEHYSCAILLPHLRVQNANAISSPLTWGFPAPSAFTGMAHALQRTMHDEGLQLRFDGVGVVCHAAQPHLADGPQWAPRGFRLTRNPLDKNGDVAAIVEEGRMHLELSLLLSVSGIHAPKQEGEHAEQLADRLLQRVCAMRLAGGSVLPPTGLPRPAQRPKTYVWADREQHDGPVLRQLRRRLLPGYALLERPALLHEHLQQMRMARPETSTLDALLDLCAVHHGARVDDDGKTQWASQRRRKGILVPVPAGYAAISELHPPGTVRNARDRNTPFCFVESLLTLGEWRSPHRLKNLDQLFWRHRAEPEHGLYRTAQTIEIQ